MVLVENCTMYLSLSTRILYHDYLSFEYWKCIT